eukprot:scaffold154812_cov18-Tisochrysis_lutea.AAC.1
MVLQLSSNNVTPPGPHHGELNTALPCVFQDEFIDKGGGLQGYPDHKTVCRSGFLRQKLHIHAIGWRRTHMLDVTHIQIEGSNYDCAVFAVTGCRVKTFNLIWVGCFTAPGQIAIPSICSTKLFTKSTVILQFPTSAKDQERIRKEKL